jgi:hypothetical protein
MDRIRGWSTITVPRFSGMVLRCIQKTTRRIEQMFLNRHHLLHRCEQEQVGEGVEGMTILIQNKEIDDRVVKMIDIRQMDTQVEEETRTKEQQEVDPQKVIPKAEEGHPEEGHQEEGHPEEGRQEEEEIEEEVYHRFPLPEYYNLLNPRE